MKDRTPDPRDSTVRQMWGIPTALFACLAVVSGYFVRQTKWIPRMELDLAGILWLMGNTPKMASWAALVVSLALMIHFARRLTGMD